MTYKALYRTYRPHSFDTVVGQRHIVQTLQNALKANKMSHAYLFCGPRGTGKTTVAKLLAKSVNCLNPSEAPCNHCEHCTTIQNGTHPDVIEIDAASNNGVDEIRDLIEKVKYAPLQAKYKVYIIDEVHMLSQGAFNALLKTLEEPPSHVIFILATTEPHKVLPTIISRCQRYDFVRVGMKEIQERVEDVLTQEKIEFEPEATRLISQLADGGVRDALSILEQCIAYGGTHLTTQHVNEIYGIATTQDKLKILEAIIQSDVSVLMSEIELITHKNIDIRRLTNDLMELLKESVVYAYTKDAKLLNKLTIEEAKLLNRIPNDRGLKMIEDLMETAEKYRSASNLLSYFEIGLLKVMGRIAEMTVEEPKPSVKVVPKESKPILQEPVKVEVAKAEIKTEDKVAPKLEEPKVEPKSISLPKMEIQHVDKMMAVTLFVSADRQIREKLNEEWIKVNQAKQDLKHGRIANLLSEAQIKAANQDFILVTHTEDYLINEINSLDNQKLIREFTQHIFGRSKKIFAIDDQMYTEATVEFKRLKSTNQLPTAMSFEEETKETQTEEKDHVELGLFSLFGEENVKIV